VEELLQENRKLKEELAATKNEMEVKIATAVKESKAKIVDLFSAQLNGAMNATDKQTKAHKTKLAKERKIWLSVVVALSCIAIFFAFR